MMTRVIGVDGYDEDDDLQERDNDDDHPRAWVK
jgi:hypothetical protein